LLAEESEGSTAFPLVLVLLLVTTNRAVAWVKATSTSTNAFLIFFFGDLP
jgi:hypothetical protein